MRKLPCLVLLAVCCFILPHGARALTPTEVEVAVYNALTTAPLNFSGGQLNVVPWLYPALNSPTVGEYMMYTFGNPSGSSLPNGDTLMESIWTIRDGIQSNRMDRATLVAVSNLLSSIVDGVWEINGPVATYLPYLGNINYAVDDIKLRVDQLSFDANGALWTHDVLSDELLDTVVTNFYDLIGSASEIYESANNIYAYISGQGDSRLEDLLGMLGAISNLVAGEILAVDQAETDIEDSVDYGLVESESVMDQNEATAQEDYEDIPLPTVSDGWVPTFNQSDLQDSQNDAGLGALQAAESHNALVTLVPRTGSAWSPSLLNPIPPIEIDFGRDSALDSALNRLSPYFAWMYGMLFTLLASVKAIGMYRKVRLATSALAVDERALPISLKYDPF